MMEFAKGVRDGGIGEGGRVLHVGGQSQRARGSLVLPAARGPEAENQLAERRIRMIDVSLIDRDECIRELARDAAQLIAVHLEVPSLCRFQIRSDSRAAGIVKLLWAGFRPALNSGNVAKISLATVDTANPEARRRIAFASILAPQEPVYAETDLGRTTQDRTIVAFKKCNQVFVIDAILDDLLIAIVREHHFEMR